MTHLGKGEIEAFLAGRSSQEDRDHLLKHLLTPWEWGLRLFNNPARPLREKEPWTHVEAVPEDAYDAPLARAVAGARRFATRWRNESKRLSRALALLEQAPRGFRDPGFLDQKARGLHEIGRASCRE